VFFFHFLVMTAALLGLPRTDEYCHCLENLVHSSQMLVDEVAAVDL
jgi:hypothetical protein